MAPIEAARPERWWHGPALIVGHYAFWATPALLVVLAAISISGSDLTWTAFMVTLAGWSGAVAAEHHHSTSLCLRCVQAAPLLDPQRAVDKRDRELRVYHSRALALSLPVILVLTLGPTLFRDHHLWSHVVKTVGLAAVLLLGAYRTVAQVVHRRLDAWCPYCRRDDGGDGPNVDDPVGPPAGRRTSSAH